MANDKTELETSAGHSSAFLHLSDRVTLTFDLLT